MRRDEGTIQIILTMIGEITEKSSFVRFLFSFLCVCQIIEINLNVLMERREYLKLVKDGFELV